jgi:hypothetical protein
MSDEPFKIDISNLRRQAKDVSAESLSRSDAAAEEHGFIDREPRRKRGRAPSPRTGQVHAKVMPHVSDEIADEAKRRGVQQGVIIEEAWALYKAR